MDHFVIAMQTYFRKAVAALLVLSFWYASAYILMMDWRRTAYDLVNGRWTEESAYRFAPVAKFNNPYTRAAPSECWANRVFWPIDFLVRSGMARLRIKGRWELVEGDVSRPAPPRWDQRVASAMRDARVN